MGKAFEMLKQLDKTDLKSEYLDLIEKSELEKKKITEHLNYLYKEYYTTRKNIEKRENNI